MINQSDQEPDYDNQDDLIPFSVIFSLFKSCFYLMYFILQCFTYWLVVCCFFICLFVSFLISYLKIQGWKMLFLLMRVPCTGWLLLSGDIITDLSQGPTWKTDYTHKNNQSDLERFFFDLLSTTIYGFNTSFYILRSSWVSPTGSFIILSNFPEVQVPYNKRFTPLSQVTQRIRDVSYDLIVAEGVTGWLLGYPQTNQEPIERLKCRVQWWVSFWDCIFQRGPWYSVA